MQIAPSTYYDHVAKCHMQEKLSTRARNNLVWHEEIARCTVERLMRNMGIQGVVRGKKPRTTIANPADIIALDRVNRNFCSPAPNML